jgi:cytochrome P450
LLTSGGDKWTKRRKLLTPSFHFDILKSYLLTINEEADIFVQKISQQNLKKKIELLPFITRFTLDTICSTAMGENVNAQCNEESEYLKSVLRLNF